MNGQGYTLANGKGRLTHTSADNGQAITVTDYDPVGRLDDFWQCTPFNCATGKLWDERYAYFPDGKINTEVRAEGYYVSYGVGNDGRYNAINNGLSGANYPQQLAVIYYAPQGAVSEIENQCAGTGCTENVQLYDYNNRLELVRSRLGSGSNATSIDCVVYNYYGNEANPTSCAIPSQGTGNDGNVLGKYYQDNVNASLSHTTSMSYDPTHRLTGAVASGSSTSSYNLTFVYDQFGNMTCQQNAQTQGLCPPFSFSSSTNRITNSGYTYDASGDLTADGTYTYQYDAEGRLISVDNGSTASYVYNALGERVEKDVAGVYTEYLFDKDGNPEAENNRSTTNNGWVDSWVYFEGQHIAHFENGGVYYIYSNQVGTAGFVTDWTGAVVQDELHYPWGQVWTMMGTQTEERFASLHHRDTGTNLDPTHFRMYSSDEGRWLTPDPAEADIYNPQSMSRYAYAGSNPFAFMDPSGALLSLSQVWSGSDLSSMMGYGGYTLDGVPIPLFSSMPVNGDAQCPSNVCSGFFSGTSAYPPVFMSFAAFAGGASGYFPQSFLSQGVYEVNGTVMSDADYTAYMQQTYPNQIAGQCATVAADIAADAPPGSGGFVDCNDVQYVQGSHANFTINCGNWLGGKCAGRWGGGLHIETNGFGQYWGHNDTASYYTGSGFNWATFSPWNLAIHFGVDDVYGNLGTNMFPR